jgi:protein O-GlcNAc transferase
MATISEALAMAIDYHRAGRLQAAEEIYRQIVAVEPNHADAWNLLGVVNSKRGNHQAAMEYICRAIGLAANTAAYHCNLGNVYQRVMKRDKAVDCYRKALELNPDFVEALYNLGNVYQGERKRDEAVDCYRRALALRPDFADAHDNLANVLQVQGKRDEAVDSYRRALALKPDFAEAHNNLGCVLQDLGKPHEAVDCYRRALELKPDFAGACYNLGNVLQVQGKRDEAVDCYRRAVALKPNFAEAHNGLGNALKDQGKWDEAVDCFRRALELKPDYADAHNNLGNVFKHQGKRDEAVDCFRRALELKPDDLAAIGALVYELQQICQWEDLQGLSRRIIEAVDADTANEIAAPVSPLHFLALPTMTTAEQQLRCARRWVEGQLKSPVESGHSFALVRPADPKSKITVGYLSADFHSHATAMLTAGLFEKHDRGRFAIFGYSYGPNDGSRMRQRVVNAFDRFVDVTNLSFTQAAQRIAADEVDILVDLKGYTLNTRTPILALRPAPIQVNYLGYPGTMGASFMDYILVDDFVVPPEQQAFFTEKLVHLAGCYQVNDSQREISPHTPSRAECGLPQEGFVFCCFNNSYKITSEIFGVWMKLLEAVPGSVLWLLEGNRFAPANLRREAKARGVAVERLIFAPRIPPAEHLARHRHANLFLDTVPYNAHTTASEALWAGCPVLTIAGETFASRVAGSLLRTLNLPELVTTQLDEYEQAAMRLAMDPQQLTELRARLLTNRATSALFDTAQFVGGIERAYVSMWEIYTSGEKPRAFRVNPL